MRRIKLSGANAYTAGADLSGETSIGKLMDRAAAYEPVTCLVNNASVFERRRAGHSDPGLMGHSYGGKSVGAAAIVSGPLRPPWPTEFPAIL